MNTYQLELHPVYGAIPHAGEKVDAGEIIGLSPDGKAVVIAPESGEVQLFSVNEPSGRRLFVHIAAASVSAARSA
jgi:hypothetical protein